MLNYEQFKVEVRKKLIPMMGEKYKNCRYKEMPVNKSGRVKDGFGVYRKSNKNIRVMPTLYYDDLYSDYIKRGDIDSVIRIAADAMVDGMKNRKEITKCMDLSKRPEHVIFQLVNTDEYGAMLNKIPHREFLDLSIIYRWAVNVTPEGLSSAIIDNDMASSFNLSEEDLYNNAMESTRKLFPPQIHSVEEIAYEMFKENGSSEEHARNMASIIPPERNFHFITNGCRQIGAVVVLYEEVLMGLSHKFDSDLYVFPYSNSEMLVVPTSFEGVIDEVLGFIKQHNEIKMEDEFVLSNNIYFYDKDTSTISCYDS